MDTNAPTHARSGLRACLTPVNVWALAFGCAVGWGAFVMPGTTFLPIGGPLGTAVGMALGALVMLVIGFNYHYMMNHYPDAGGTYSYAKNIFGYDHGFLGAWFLMLVYIAILWANATALPLIFRHLLGPTFQMGFHYEFAGYQVYLGEAILALAALWIFGFACMRGGAFAARLQTLLAFLLFGGILASFGAALAAHGRDILSLAPPFPPGKDVLPSVLGIVVLAPWAFAGFESVSQAAEEFRFSPRKTFAILAAAVMAGAVAYILLALLAISVLPAGYGNWPPYLRDIGRLPGLEGLPTFHAAHAFMGSHGLLLLGATVLAAVITGLAGNFIAVSRLLYAMARDGLFPEWLGRLNRAGVPANALLLVMLLSLPIPFLGRTAISWIVDITTIGATIAYAYTSAVAFRAACLDGNRIAQATGILGCAISLLFFLYFMVPNPWTVSPLATESYLILIGWGISGFMFFRYIFQRDTKRRFGQSTIVWIALLFLIFFTSMLWLREATQDTSKRVLNNLSEYYMKDLQLHNVPLVSHDREDAEFYLQKQLDIVRDSLTDHNLLQMTIIAISLCIMFGIYNLMMKREKSMEVQKIAAEERNKAKTTFFFNMSHDIRTPMNAIIGYTTLAKKEKNLPPEVADYLDKIMASSDHLLSLINDILEMSRIENGKMELDIAEENLVKSLEEVRDLFAMQMETKKIVYTVEANNVTDPWVLCDAKRLNRILLNLISNSYKFTPEGGSVTVTLAQLGNAMGIGSYELRVKDTGMGMSPEFAATVFDAYARERTAEGIQGTGLGMAITKSIVDLMGGSIHVETEQGKGTEFIILLDFQIASGSVREGRAEKESSGGESGDSRPDFTKIHLLLVEDIEVNREIATMILGEFGFRIDTAENGKIAVEKIAASRPGDYQLILMDVQMPVMNGYEASRAIRSLEDPALSSIPIIAMTANAFAEDIQNATDAGMDGHIAKPLDVTKMMETLENVLREHDRKRGDAS